MWIIFVLTFLVAIIIFALSVPLDIRTKIDISGKPKFQVGFSWLFGLVSKDFTGRSEKPKDAKKATRDKRKFKDSRSRIKTILEVLRIRGLFRQIKILLKDLLGLFRIKDFIIDLKIGLDDPADTALAFTVIKPITSILSYNFPNRLRVEPIFADKIIFEGYLKGVLRCRPIQFVPPLLKFVFSLPTVRVMKIVVVSKWRRKESK